MKRQDIMDKSTELLESELKHANKPEDFFAHNEKILKQKTVSSYLMELLIAYELEKSDVAAKSGLSGTYAYQIFDGKKNAGRDKLIQLAFGFPLTLEETQRLLRYGGHSELYVKNRRDAFLMYAFGKSYGLDKVNQLLYENGEKTFE